MSNKFITKIILIYFIFLLGCKETIVHDLAEHQVNKFITFLSDQGIAAESRRQSDGKWTLLVDDNHKLSALKLLENQRLFSPGDSLPLEKNSLLNSKDQQKFILERSLSQEIEKTLFSLGGVLETRVHLNLPNYDPTFGRNIGSNKLGSGSVLIIAKNGHMVDQDNIAKLVSGAAGISKEAISVMVNYTTIEKQNNNLAINSIKIAKSAWYLNKKNIINVILILFSILALGYYVFLKRKVIKERKLKELYASI